MNSISTHILFLLLFFSSLVTAGNFTQCLDSFKGNASVANTTESGGVDSWGGGVIPADAVGITYRACREQCSSGFGTFEWKDFAQLFASWLLPWLALLSQLPFGSGNYVDDFVSVIMSVGSPALVAYSLALTSMAARIACRMARHTTDESKIAVARALISLQQAPLELTKDSHLLESITTDDEWIREIVERLGNRNHWTVATASSLGWVIIAFAFTLVESFVSVDGPADSVSQGHAVSIIWLWLLCLVIGWLWVPTYTCGNLKSAVGHSNQKAVKKAVKVLRQTARRAKTRMQSIGGPNKPVGNSVPGGPEVRNSAKTDITSILGQMPTLEESKEPVVHSVPEAPEEEEVKGEPIREEDTKYAGQETEPKTNPLTDSPTHHMSTVSLQPLPESQQGHVELSVSANPAVNQSVVSMARSAGEHSTAQCSVQPGTHRFLTPKECGWVNRDEFRFSATFNYSRIMGYLTLVDDVSKALDKPTGEKVEHAKYTFPPGALISMFVASMFALILLCGITAAAAAIRIFTPTIGLGCSSLGYLIYAGVAIVIMFLNIISTIFARISETHRGSITATESITAFIAIALRWISLILAFTNAVGLILMSCLQISHVLDNCYCNACVISRGTGSWVTFSYDGWTSTMKYARIGSTAIAAVCMGIYMTFIGFMSALPSQIDHVIQAPDQM